MEQGIPFWVSKPSKSQSKPHLLGHHPTPACLIWDRESNPLGEQGGREFQETLAAEHLPLLARRGHCSSLRWHSRQAPGDLFPSLRVHSELL